MSTPQSIRFAPGIFERLRRTASTHEGASVSGLVNRYVDEAIRMEEHPGVFFRSGPAGRRAVLGGGPDVWEVIRAVRYARDLSPGLVGDELVGAVSESSGVPAGKVSLAIRYWSAYPDEIDAWIEVAEADEATAEERWHRERELLIS